MDLVLRGVCVVFETLHENFPLVGEMLEWVEPIIALAKQYEAVILLLGLAYIVRRLKRERVRISSLFDDLGDKVDTSTQQAKAARDAAESMTQSVGFVPANANMPSNWELIRADWQNVRDRLEIAIGEIPRKTTRSKYSKIPRYSYNDVIIELRNDGRLSSDRAFHALISMNTLFLRLRARPANATKSHVAQFKTWLKDVNGSLPKLKGMSSPEAPQLPLADAAE